MCLRYSCNVTCVCRLLGQSRSLFPFPCKQCHQFGVGAKFKLISFLAGRHRISENLCRGDADDDSLAKLLCKVVAIMQVLMAVMLVIVQIYLVECLDANTSAKNLVGWLVQNQSQNGKDRW